MPVFENNRASRISSRFSSSIIVTDEVIDYYCANFQVEILEFECDENGTVLKFVLN